MEEEPAQESFGVQRDRATYFAWDGHWNADGHEVVAGAVPSFVRTLLTDHEHAWE